MRRISTPTIAGRDSNESRLLEELIIANDESMLPRDSQFSVSVIPNSDDASLRLIASANQKWVVVAAQHLITKLQRLGFVEIVAINQDVSIAAFIITPDGLLHYMSVILGYSSQSANQQQV